MNNKQKRKLEIEKENSIGVDISLKYSSVSYTDITEDVSLQ